MSTLFLCDDTSVSLISGPGKITGSMGMCTLMFKNAVKFHKLQSGVQFYWSKDMVVLHAWQQ